ncbi:hypothetical protein QR680_016471 [Steinernema hermaphroditum]|uniref:Dolichyl-diphosphooligosaccharide--protein glycosyltransferase subunit STT3A n=1 Tax=Steinernema hermaphroditum TaxID=289476 RepID=A0AA39LMH8_9BILA|nr:hypothetical protein QR680_016471 [Steinernema hermaphroditum]
MGITSKNPTTARAIVKCGVLVLAAIVAFSCRLFAVIRFESVIHEFDPYFNFRTTQYLTKEGFYSFLNWFDDRAWYPLGRIIGGTLYPGLMLTSGAIYKVLHAINFTVDIREVCVFLAPLFSSFTVMVTYLLTKEVFTEGAGLCAACFISVVPGYISRSVAGSYDNEAIAIFCMLFTYYCWIKSVKTGSIRWSATCALAYFYMVSSWGGYVFLINLIPLHVFILMLTGRFCHRIYVAYSIFYALGTILSMQIPFVGYQPVQTSEHMAAFGIFGLCQLMAFTTYLKSRMTESNYNQVFNSVLAMLIFVFISGFGAAYAMGKIAAFTGRFYSFLDPSYAKNNIPIIASVSEHQPTAWASFYFDLQLLALTFPAGLYYCFKNLTDGRIFIILYGITTVYFTGVMVRMMLILAPVACILGGIAISSLLDVYMPYSLEEPDTSAPKKEKSKGKASRDDGSYPHRHNIATGIVGAIMLMMAFYATHCIWVTSEAYSSPSIVLAARGSHGRIIFDDFREAYYWLRQNTAEDAKVMSWWDYGYQISAMANRTVIVDNNTWNNTHISRVGQAMASNESHAYEIMRELDVDYVLVLFGGVTAYSSDDLNKFLWMVRIGGSTPEGAHIHENDYYTKNGEFRVDKAGSPTLRNCLMYKMSYYKFGALYTEHGKNTGYDRVRRAEIGDKNVELEHLEEAYTTEHWLVRIYKVKPPKNRA